jgi:glutamate synthase (NADPH/NADH) large chain
VRGRGLEPIVWRAVPIDRSALGNQALGSMPRIEQLLIRRPDGMGEDRFERELFLARKIADRAAGTACWPEFFVVSCSARTLIYKAFCLPRDLPLFYLDLRDARYESAIVLFHQRYSTNTLPTWAMAQPFRFLAHNGEINTIGGNRLWMEARPSSRSRTARRLKTCDRWFPGRGATHSVSMMSWDFSTTGDGRFHTR